MIFVKSVIGSLLYLVWMMVFINVLSIILLWPTFAAVHLMDYFSNVWIRSAIILVGAVIQILNLVSFVPQLLEWLDKKVKRIKIVANYRKGRAKLNTTRGHNEMDI